MFYALYLSHWNIAVLSSPSFRHQVTVIWLSCIVLPQLHRTYRQNTCDKSTRSTICVRSFSMVLMIRSAATTTQTAQGRHQCIWTPKLIPLSQKITGTSVNISALLTFPVIVILFFKIYYSMSAEIAGSKTNVQKYPVKHFSILCCNYLFEITIPFFQIFFQTNIKNHDCIR
jgi:hypothetical protein